MDEGKEIDLKTQAGPRRSFLKTAGISLAAFFLGKPGKENPEAGQLPKVPSVKPASTPVKVEVRPLNTDDGQPQAGEKAVTNLEVKEVITKMEESGHPANLNRLAVEVDGVAKSTPDLVAKYFADREEQDPKMALLDKTWSQLTMKIKEFTYRGPKFGVDQGLGFQGTVDLVNLKEFPDLEKVEKKRNLFGVGSDGYWRGWAIVQAKDLKQAMETYTEGYLDLTGQDMNTKAAVAERILSDDLGIKPVPDKDGKKIGFSVGETYLDKPDENGVQPEKVTRVEFLEKVEKQTLAQQDIRNSLLLTFVVSTDGTRHVEVFALSSTADIVYPGKDVTHKSLIAKPGGRHDLSGDGGRLVPPGKESPAAVEEKVSGKPGEVSEKPKDSTIPREEKPGETIPGDSTIPQTPTEDNKDEDKPIGNLGNAKPVGKAGEKGPEFNPPPEGPGTKGKSDNPEKNKKP